MLKRTYPGLRDRGDFLQYTLFIGEMLVDFLPDPAGPDGMIHYQPHPGGAVANAAVALARLGGATRFVGKVSADSFGRMLLKTLQENGVDTRSIPITTHSNTTLALVTLQTNGQREFTFYRHQTADTLLEVADLKPEIWENVAICHLGSVLLATEPARTATLAALEQARQRGLLVTFDVNVRPALWSSETEIRATLAQVIAQVDLLKFSAEEAHYLTPSLEKPLDPADQSRLFQLGQELLNQGPALVIITRGALGALFMTRQHTSEVVTSQTSVIDTTGAGDAFSGAILYQLREQGWTTQTRLAALQTHELQSLGQFANRAAGISCTRYGGIYSLPSLAEVEAL
jgi:fructokinase